MKIAVLLVISCFIAAAYSSSLGLSKLLSITINDKRLSIERPDGEENFVGKYIS